MSYDAQEGSVSDGRPYFLYTFANTAGTTRLTSHHANLTRGGNTFTASPVSHTDIEQTGNIEKSVLKLTFPLSDSFGGSFLDLSALTTTVTVQRGHFSDGTNELAVYWKGRVVGARATATRIVLDVENVFTSMRGPGCRARYMRTCRHALYSAGCGLNKNDFDVAGTLTAMSGLVLTVPAASGADANDYRGGMIRWSGLYGFIRVHSGSSLTLLSEIPGLAEAFALSGSESVTLFPGCNLSLTRCDTRFSNSINFGGFPYMTDKNPFSSSIV